VYIFEQDIMNKCETSTFKKWLITFKIAYIKYISTPLLGNKKTNETFILIDGRWMKKQRSQVNWVLPDLICSPSLQVEKVIN